VDVAKWRPLALVAPEANSYEEIAAARTSSFRPW
jgi:hypothetical protein